MLDLPELLRKVLQHLDRHDLTRCARVNKQWHALTIPHIWCDLACVCSDNARKEAFRKIVLEDYLRENGHEGGPPQSSVLSKHGHLIRLLPNPMDLESTLQTQARTQQGNDPTAHDLLFHLFKRSSKAQVNYLRYQFKDLESDNMESILAFTLPRLRSLVIRASLQGTQSELIKIKSLLNQCSTSLRKLVVNIGIMHGYEAFDMEGEAPENEPICWTSLKELALEHHPDTWNAGPFWSWIWKRCGQVEKLRVHSVNKSASSLGQAMLAYMHNLQEIAMGGDGLPFFNENPHSEMEDDVVAVLLSGSRHGWKTIQMKWTAKPGQKTMDALALHYSTLEELHIDGCNYLPSCDMVQILRSCPRLHTLIYTDTPNGSSTVDGMTFIDLDPDTGLLKPWLCEGSLKVLVAKISGIPRPDSEIGGFVAEAYPGQGREIQTQVYDRLGRLTHLEKLKLGYRFVAGLYTIGRPGTLLEMSLEMSLESGLDKLSGLKSLKELDLQGLATNIGVSELQWMVENWPKFSAIYGIDWRERGVEVITWLREHLPKMKV